VADQITLLDSPRMRHKDALRIGAMWTRHGKREGARCRTCESFVGARSKGRRYAKCVRFGVSACVSSDWSGRFVACGVYGEQA